MSTLEGRIISLEDPFSSVQNHVTTLLAWKVASTSTLDNLKNNLLTREQNNQIEIKQLIEALKIEQNQQWTREQQRRIKESDEKARELAEHGFGPVEFKELKTRHEQKSHNNMQW